MSFSADQIIDAVMKLPESDRWLIATRILETLPDDFPGLSEDAPGIIEELDRRANDTEPTIPASELWKRD